MNAFLSRARPASRRSKVAAALRYTGAALTALTLAACRTSGAGGTCSDCRRLVIAAVGEPPSVLPPLVQETVGRDVAALVFERLADLAPGSAPMDPSAFRPGLASSWTHPDDSSFVFTLRRGARWHDGTPVTAEDVAFSYSAYTDTSIGAPGLPTLRGYHVTAVDPSTVRVTIPVGAPEPLYDLTFGVRILPKHIWGSQPVVAWPQDTVLAHLVGSGPYRVITWQRGEYLRLTADSTRPEHPALDTLVWRFAADPPSAATLLLSHEADVMETLITPPNVARVAADSTLRVVRYPSAAYGFLAWQITDGKRRPHAILGDRTVRRALGAALDRPAMAQAVYGPRTAVPQGPMSQALFLHDTARVTVGRDSAKAAALLDVAGWARGADGVRRRQGKPLAIEVLVPSTSGARRALAEAAVEAWRGLGVQGTIASVDFAVFQQRLAEGRFDAYIGSYLDEPSPRGVAVQWGTSGIGQLNYGRWSDARFDALLAAATRATTTAEAARRYREAFDTLEAAAPASFLFAPTAAMGASRRLTVTEPIDPFDWLGGVARWRKRARLPSDQ